MGDAIPKSRFAPDAALAVEARVKASGTSFYWAMRLQPKAKRRALYAVYAFCREVDDIADSKAPRAKKIASLERWRAHIENLFRGKPANLIARALRPAIKDYRLGKQAFLAIIAGMEMDAKGPIVAPSWRTLDLYCARVASAVGLLCIRIFGEGGKEGQAVAETLGRALQFTNILRDLKEDAGTGRLYLPKELLQKHGITERAPAKVLANPKLDPACRELLALAEKEFARAERALSRCDQRAVKPAVIMKDVYRATLARLKVRGFAPEAVNRPDHALSKHARKIEKLFIAIKSLA
jgi:presqualene diphosphate synthase